MLNVKNILKKEGEKFIVQESEKWDSKRNPLKDLASFRSECVNFKVQEELKEKTEEEIEATKPIDYNDNDEILRLKGFEPKQREVILNLFYGSAHYFSIEVLGDHFIDLNIFDGFEVPKDPIDEYLEAFDQTPSIPWTKCPAYKEKVPSYRVQQKGLPKWAVK